MLGVLGGVLYSLDNRLSRFSGVVALPVALHMSEQLHTSNGFSLHAPRRTAEERAEMVAKVRGVWALKRQGDTLLNQGDPDGAIHAYRRSMQLGSPHGSVHVGLCDALLAKGNIEAAVREGEIAVASLPLNARARFKLAVALARHDRFEAAVHSYTQGVRLLPKENSEVLPLSPTATMSAMILLQAAAYTGAGIAAYFRSEEDEAARDLGKAIEIDPNFAAAYLYLGNLLNSKGQPDEARVMFEQAAARGSDYVAAKARQNLSR